MVPPCKNRHTPTLYRGVPRIDRGVPNTFGSLCSPAGTPLTKFLKPPLAKRCLHLNAQIFSWVLYLYSLLLDNYPSFSFCPPLVCSSPRTELKFLIRLDFKHKRHLSRFLCIKVTFCDHQWPLRAIYNLCLPMLVFTIIIFIFIFFLCF